MSGPLIMISHSRVKPGHRSDYEEHAAEALEMVEAEEPRMIGINHFADDDDLVATVQIHPDADSLDTHLQFFGQRLAGKVSEALDVTDIYLYGRPSDSALAVLAQMPGLEVHLMPQHRGGLLRPQPV